MAKLTYEQALAKLYTEAEEKLIKTIKRKAKYGNATAYERSLLKQVEEQIEMLRKSSDKMVQELVKSNYKAGLEQLLKDVSVDKTAPRSYNLMSRLNVNQINIIVDNITQQLNQAIATVGRRCDDYIRQITLEATAKKLTQGQTVRQMQKELEAQLAENEITSISYANGAEHNIKDYASMVARTTTAETQNTAQVVQGNAWGYDLVRMTSHYPTCKICAMYQGRVYALTKEAANGKYKDKNGKSLMFAYLYDTALVDGYNTIHPNCRHRFAILPVRAYTLDELAEFSRQSTQPFEDTRSDEERKAYAKEQTIKRKRNESRRQYEEFKRDFPDQAPKTFAVWQRKRNKSRRQYEDVKKSLPDQTPKTFATWWKMETTNSQRYQDLMKNYRTSQKAVDNSSGSGIIAEKEMLPRKVKQGDFAVNWSMIQSQEYSDKFKKISTDERVASSIETRVKWALSNRDTLQTEELYAVSLNNGREVARITDQNNIAAVQRTKSFTTALDTADINGEHILLIHNHPRGMPPSIADINALISNKNVSGITAGHNGSIYYYTKPKQIIPKDDWVVAMKHFNKFSEETAMEKTLELLSKKYSFKIKRL